jgi:hypothetical protein
LPGKFPGLSPFGLKEDLPLYRHGYQGYQGYQGF